MDTRMLSVLLIVVPVGLGGCIGTDDAVDTSAIGTLTPIVAPALEAAAWNDPQQFPHPAFNWPTITHVPPHAPAWWQPITARQLPAEITGFDDLGAGGSGWGGDGFGLFGGLAVLPGAPGAAALYDVRDPTAVKQITTIDVGMQTRQSLFMPHEDGRLFALFATDAGLIPIWDVTDPEHPMEVTVLEVENNGHTIAIVPGTPILYNANAAGSLPAFPFNPARSTGRQTEVFDLSDPANPELVQVWKNGYGCHAISFHITSDRARAYCAGVDATQIWDIADPKAPTVVSTTPMPHGRDPLPPYPILVTVSHWAVVNDDATIMAVADETGGGALPMCDAYVDAAGRPVSGPLGNVWFYDITDEANPVLVGWVSPSAHFTYEPRVGACTAHVGRMVPHPDLDLLVMSFYAGGVALIDFTDPTAPRIAAHWLGEDPMDAWYYNGYVFVGDATDGLDVLALV